MNFKDTDPYSDTKISVFFSSLYLKTLLSYSPDKQKEYHPYSRSQGDGPGTRPWKRVSSLQAN